MSAKENEELLAIEKELSAGEATAQTDNASQDEAPAQEPAATAPAPSAGPGDPPSDGPKVNFSPAIVGDSGEQHSDENIGPIDLSSIADTLVQAGDDEDEEDKTPQEPPKGLKAKILFKLQSLKKKKKKKKKEPSKLLTVVMQVLLFPLFIVKMVLSGNQVLAFCFVASLILLTMTSVQLFQKYIPKDFFKATKSETGNELDKFFKLQRELTEAKDRLVFLESYKASLKYENYPPKLLEFEFFAEFAEVQTGRLVREHIVEFQEAISSQIQYLSYQALLKEEGKEELKKVLIKSIEEKLKKLHSTGQVKDIFITKFIMGG